MTYLSNFGLHFWEKILKLKKKEVRESLVLIYLYSRIRKGKYKFSKTRNKVENHWGMKNNEIFTSGQEDNDHKKTQLKDW
jgi:hypothetical protein